MGSVFEALKRKFLGTRRIRDGVCVAFYSNTTPSSVQGYLRKPALAVGDTWFDTGAHTLHIWTGTEWEKAVSDGT